MDRDAIDHIRFRQKGPGGSGAFSFARPNDGQGGKAVFDYHAGRVVDNGVENLILFVNHGGVDTPRVMDSLEMSASPVLLNNRSATTVK